MIADTYVNQIEPEVNKGGQNILYASNRADNEPSGGTYSNDNATIFLMFDVSGLTGLTITSALLFLKTWSAYSPVTAQVAAYYLSDNSWNELGITWNSQPVSAISASPTAETTVASAGTLYSWDITPDVLNSIPAGRLSIVLKVSSPNAFVWFSSKESGQPPYLSVTYPVTTTATSTTTIVSTSVTTATQAVGDPSRVRILSPADGSTASGVVEVQIWYNTPVFAPAAGSCAASIRFAIDGNVIHEGSIISPCDSVYVNQMFPQLLYTTQYSDGQHVLRAEMKMYHPDLGWFGWWYDEISIIITNAVTTTTTQTSTQTSTVETSTFTVTTQTLLTATQTVTTTITATFQVTIQNTIVQIVSNSTVSNLIFDSTRGILNFTVSGPSGTIGYFNATIAKSLLLGSPIVIVDGTETQPTITESESFWHIYVAYSHSVRSVTIGGSMVIPEFKNTAILLATVALIATLCAARKRRTYFARKETT